MKNFFLCAFWIGLSLGVWGAVAAVLLVGPWWAAVPLWVFVGIVYLRALPTLPKYPRWY